MWSILVSALLAAEYYVETSPLSNREDATAVWDKARAAGLSPRVVRRFRLGHGWEWVVQVDGFATESDATQAATRLANSVGLTTTIYLEEERARPVPVAPPAADEAPAVTAGAWIERAAGAMGGPSGGASALARAGAVHFVYTRTYSEGGKTYTTRHDYWREGGYRRLQVRPGDAGVDSLAVVTPSAAWITSGGVTRSRDIGVAVGAVDAFAPEAVLTLALEAHRLLNGQEAKRFLVLEGAEHAVRLGAGAGAPDIGLTWVDVDPATARLLRARYVTEAGPLEWELQGWREVAPGILVPGRIGLLRADGTSDNVVIDTLEVLDRAPEGTFPSSQPSSP